MAIDESVDPAGSDTITGHAEAWEKPLIEQLLRLKQQGQLPHAIVIEMQTAVDSRAFGWWVVQALLCQQPGADGLPCGQCSHCHMMQANSYPDFSFTTLEPNERSHKLNRDIKIEQIRKLIHRLSLTTSQQAGKYALIYPAERMNISSANSLLKTLEEPTTDATLVLLTHNAGRLPVTIRSRCQQWQVPRPDDQIAMQWLAEKGVAKGDIEVALKLARGDAQLALQLYRQDSLRHLQTFQALLKDYLSGRCTVLDVAATLKPLPEEELQMILQHVLVSLIYKQLEHPLEQPTKQRLIELLELIKHAGFVLQSKENNLILQLQLEDVLISLKNILNREKLHARTIQPGNTVA